METAKFQRIVYLVVAAAVPLLCVCSNGRNIHGPAAAPLSVSSELAELTVGETTQFTADKIGLSNSKVAWSAKHGTMNASGLYTAPDRPGRDIVNAQIVGSSGLTYTVAITIATPSISDLPSPLRVVNYQPSSTFFSEEEDLKIIREAFNAVLISNSFLRRQKWRPLRKIIDAGLVPIISFDAAKFLFRGNPDELKSRTDQVIAGIKAAPFPIRFLKVGDELNYGRPWKEDLQTIPEIVTYLDMTARRLKEAGLVILVDATAPELYGHTIDREPYTIAGLDAIISTGYVDGVMMGNPGHRRGDEAVIAQWKNARELWPQVPFFSRSASFSFTENTFEESGKNVHNLIRWSIDIPDSLGSLGVQLWAWRRENRDGTVAHLRNADGQANESWTALAAMID